MSTSVAIPPSAIAPVQSAFEFHYSHLPAEEQETATKLVSCLNAPIDIPLSCTVIATVASQVDAYRDALESPSPAIESINARLTALARAIRSFPADADELDRPLMRRLTNHSAWALAIELSQLKGARPESKAFAVEVALSLATGKRFANGFAKNLRTSLQGFPATANDEAAWMPHFRRASRYAAGLFELDGVGAFCGTPDTDINAQVRFELLRTARFAPAKHRQGVGEPQSLHPLALKEASIHLARECAAGNQTALVIVLALCAGVSYATARRLPLFEGAGDWVMLIDIEGGTIKTCLESVFENAAKAIDGVGTRPATRVVVKPMPKFLRDALRAAQASGRPTSVAELLPQSDATPTTLTIGDRHSACPITAARALKSRARLCIESGQDRLATACVLNDYSVIPSSKIYYCLIHRQEIWDASSAFYSALGWGEETAEFAPGLPFGSQIVPEDSSIRDWLAWMDQNVKSASPGKRYSAKSLFEHHNRFARLCASVAAFALALREQKQFQLSATDLDGVAKTINIHDKAVGWFPRPTPVPVAAFLREQSKLWRSHCQALDRRLEKLGFDEAHPVRKMLRMIQLRVNVPAFFLVNARTQPKALGSSDLRGWWPQDYRFSSDWGRHFWESKLRHMGVPSSDIDVLLRHHVAGLEQWHGTTSVTAAERLQRISSAQDLAMSQLGFVPVIGLSSKGGAK